MQLKDLQEQLQYLGREAKRSDSRMRRQAILEATLRIVSRDGICAVRHRAVAAEANVPLAATSYYFEDINTLLHDAFVYYIATEKERTIDLEAQVDQLIEAFCNGSDAAGKKISGLRWALVDMLTAHLHNNLQDSPARNIEMAYRHEALRNTLVAMPFKQLHQAQLATIGRFFARLGSTQPEVEARSLLCILLNVEYDAQLYGVEAVLKLAEAMLYSALRGISLERVQRSSEAPS